MENTLTITPTIIRHKGDDTLSVVYVPHEESGERALLIFASPEAAETFRREAGRYTGEGFKAVSVDIDKLRTIFAVYGYNWVAVPELDGPDRLDFFEAHDFMWLLLSSLIDEA